MWSGANQSNQIHSTFNGSTIILAQRITAVPERQASNKCHQPASLLYSRICTPEVEQQEKHNRLVVVEQYVCQAGQEDQKNCRANITDVVSDFTHSHCRERRTEQIPSYRHIQSDRPIVLLLTWIMFHKWNTLDWCLTGLGPHPSTSPERLIWSVWSDYFFVWLNCLLFMPTYV